MLTYFEHIGIGLLIQVGCREEFLACEGHLATEFVFKGAVAFSFQEVFLFLRPMPTSITLFGVKEHQTSRLSVRGLTTRFSS